MEDHSLSGQTWVIFALTAVTIILGAVVFYLWLRRRRFTRQRYAFFAALAIASIVSLVITSITSQNPWYAVASVLSYSFGITNPLSDSNHWAENVLVLVMGVAGCYLIYKIFAIWDGGQTESGYKLSPHFPSIVDIQCGEKAILL